MKLYQRLIDATKDIWAQYNEHPFVKGIENGTLSKDKFRYYIIQDYMYLVDYARVFAIGIAKSKDLQLSALFSHYVQVLTGTEMDIHRGYMGVLNVTQQEIDQMPVSLDNLSYTSYMIRIAYEEGIPEILAAILSCAVSYETIAKNMVKNNPACIEDEFYGDWVKGYISEKYSEENVVLIEALEKWAADCTEQQLQHLVDIFVACSKYELNFWEMSWNMK